MGSIPKENMKTTLIIIVALTAFSFTNINCRSKSNKNDLQQSAKTVGSIQSNSNDSLDRKSSVINVKGTVYFTSPYCGGARPTDEIIEGTKKLRLMTSSTIFLVNDKNPTEKINVTTGNDGTFKYNLQAGTYSYYMTSDFNKNIGIEFSSSDPSIRDMKFGSFNVSDKMSKPLTLVYHFICGPETRMRP
jgi:hypothetical protein